MQLRRPGLSMPVAQQGQVLYLFAVLLVGILGVGALALDVGLAYHQRQQQENMATNAALAGAYEVYGTMLNRLHGTPTATNSDARVRQAMVNVLNASGLVVASATPLGGDACASAAPYPANEVYLVAQYVNQQGTPLPSYVGNVTAVPTAAAGVQVDTLGGCSRAFLAPVVGRQNFAVSANAAAGSYVRTTGGSVSGGGATDTPIPTVPGGPLASLTATSTPLPTLTDTASATPTATPSATATLTVTPTPTATTSNCPTGSGDVIALSTDTSSDHLYMASGATVQAAGVMINGTSTNSDVVWMDGGSIGSSSSQAQVTIQTGSRSDSPITNQNNAGMINGQNGSSRNSTAYPSLQVVTTSTADPLASMAASPPATPAGATTPIQCSSSSCASGSSSNWNFNAGNTYAFQPGSYGNVNFNSNATFCFAPGIYYVSGDWNIDASDTLRPFGDTQYCPGTGAGNSPGVLFYFASGHMQINNGGDMTHLTAMSTGAYAGLLYWQAGSDDPTPDYSFSGGGFYAPNAAVTFNSGATFNASYVITKTMHINSGASITATQGSSCQSQQTSATATATATATVDTTTQYTVSSADVMIYGNIPGPMLYGQGSPGYAAGDLVTLFGNGKRWATNQYANQTQALSGTPGGVSVHDGSMEGCYASTQGTLPTSISIDTLLLDFNHGGVGHCTLPTGPGTIAIPIVNEVYKNDGTCSANGGYCEEVIAIVDVTIPDSSSITNQQITGYITGVVADPYGIVQLATPTATPTATATPNATATWTPVPTGTTLPPSP